MGYLRTFTLTMDWTVSSVLTSTVHACAGLARGGLNSPVPIGRMACGITFTCSELRFYWSDAILGRLRPGAAPSARPRRVLAGGVGLYSSGRPRCEEIWNSAPTESPLATRVTRQGATDATGQAAGAGHACGGTLEHQEPDLGSTTTHTSEVDSLCHD
jgi:hypothetical protein